MEKYLGEKKFLDTRQFREIIVEYYTDKTPEEIIKLHQVVEKDIFDERIVQLERILLEWIHENRRKEYDRDYIS